MAKEYFELLKDPRWQRKRLEILQRDNFTCRICGAIDKELHVHHRYYAKGKLPWEYESHTLTTACTDCHETLDDLRKRLVHAIGTCDPFWYTEILGFIQAKALWGHEGESKIKLLDKYHLTGIALAIRIPYEVQQDFVKLDGTVDATEMEMAACGYQGAAASEDAHRHLWAIGTDEDDGE